MTDDTKGLEGLQDRDDAKLMGEQAPGAPTFRLSPDGEDDPREDSEPDESDVAVKLCELREVPDGELQLHPWERRAIDRRNAWQKRLQLLNQLRSAGILQVSEEAEAMVSKLMADNLPKATGGLSDRIGCSRRWLARRARRVSRAALRER